MWFILCLADTAALCRERNIPGDKRNKASEIFRGRYSPNGYIFFLYLGFHSIE